MADKLDPTKVDSAKLRADLIKNIKDAINVYSKTVEEIKSRELKKAELCLLCGNEDKPGKCICLKKSEETHKCGFCKNKATHSFTVTRDNTDKNSTHHVGYLCSDHVKNPPYESGSTFNPKPLRKNDVMGYGDANMTQGGAPMMASEHPEVQGAMAVKDKKESDAKLPTDKITHDQPDEGSGGLSKDEALAGMKNPGKAGRTVAALRARSVHPQTVASLGAIKLGAMKAKPVMNMGKKEDSYSQHKVEVNMKEFKKNPSKFPGGKKQAIAIGLSEGREHAKKAEIDTGDKKINTRLKAIRANAKGLPKNNRIDGPIKQPMAKTSIEQANKELGSAKSIASKPMPGMGTKVANPHAMSPGPGAPKPVAGTMGKSESNKAKLTKALGKCAMCRKDEHEGLCKGLNTVNHSRNLLKIK